MGLHPSDLDLAFAKHQCSSCEWAHVAARQSLVSMTDKTCVCLHVALPGAARRVGHRFIAGLHAQLLPTIIAISDCNSFQMVQQDALQDGLGR